jgi:NADPH2:quinone reductase
MGLNIIGTAGTQRGLDLIKKEGAHHSFDHTKPGYAEEILKLTGGRGIDIVLEMLANINLATDMKLLARQGRVIVIGNRGEITINPRELMARRASVRGFTLWAVTEPESSEIHAGISAGLENGTLRPVVGKELPLKDALQAHLDIVAPGAFGKIVLVP